MIREIQGTAIRLEHFRLIRQQLPTQRYFAGIARYAGARSAATPFLS